MDIEPVPKKIQKTEEEIREEIKQELKEEQKKAELKEEKKEEKKHRIGKIISRFIWGIIILFVLFETIIGVLDMQRLNDDKEPVWYFSEKTEEKDGKKETTYNLGLYVIVKTKAGKETKISLKPFFLK